MGILVTFHCGAPDGLAGILLDGLKGFRDWYEAQVTEPSSGFDDVTVLERADDILALGASALSANNVESARQVDALVQVFVGDYCDWGPGRKRIRPASQNALALRRFEACQTFIQENASTDTSGWWDLMLLGRPVGRDAQRLPFVPMSSGGMRVAFATSDEARRLLADLEPIARRYNDESSPHALDIAVESLAHVTRLRTGLVVTIA